MTAPTHASPAHRAARLVQRRTQRLVRAQAEAMQRVWSRVDPGSLAASFRPVAPELVDAITVGQAQGAGLAAPYLAAVVGVPAAMVVPAAFAGRTASGLALGELTDLVLSRMLAELAAGWSGVDVIGRGLRRTLLYCATEITDASRVATQVQVAVDERIAGYERVVQLPACDRCILLAGRLYRYSEGFRRHPRCDCHMVPVTREQWRTGRPENTPRALFNAMSEAEQAKRFGAGTAAAIRAGADIFQVVNARSGAMHVAGRWVTSSGITSRGTAGRRMGELAKQPGQRYRRSRAPRPTAAQIMHDAESLSRTELLAELYRFGYLA